MGFHEHKSKVDKVYLLHRKSDAADCIMKYAAGCESHNVTLYRLHTDNAPEFHVYHEFSNSATNEASD